MCSDLLIGKHLPMEVQPSLVVERFLRMVEEVLLLMMRRAAEEARTRKSKKRLVPEYQQTYMEAAEAFDAGRAELAQAVAALKVIMADSGLFP